MNDKEREETKELETVMHEHLCYHEKVKMEVEECRKVFKDVNGDGWLKRLIERFANVGKKGRAEKNA